MILWVDRLHLIVTQGVWSVMELLRAYNISTCAKRPTA
ncbi:hypothetical protein PCAR4_390070 [Paraburkholderia caribensis]|nr:hypothetical protein PCAR4_390070 [Paraburkholderia caribensis]